MHKIMIPLDLNPQGPWAQEAANEAWTHPKSKKRHSAPTPAAQAQPAAAPIVQASNAEAENDKPPECKKQKRRATDNPAHDSRSDEQIVDDAVTHELINNWIAVMQRETPPPTEIDEQSTESPQDIALAEEATAQEQKIEDSLAVPLEDASEEFVSVPAPTQQPSPEPIKPPPVDSPRIVSSSKIAVAGNATGEQLLAKAAELRQSVTQLLAQHNDLEARRKIFIAVTYDQIINSAKRMIASIDERLAKTKGNAQLETQDQEQCTRAMLDAAEALIESGVDLIFPIISDNEPSKHRAIKEPRRQRSASKERLPNRRRCKYMVQLNDTCESIATEQFKNADTASLIFQINQHLISTNPVTNSAFPGLPPGVVLLLPSEAEVIQLKRIS